MPTQDSTQEEEQKKFKSRVEEKEGRKRFMLYQQFACVYVVLMLH